MTTAVLWLFRKLLRLTLWIYDEEAATAKNSDLHRKLIWELKEAIKELEKP